MTKNKIQKYMNKYFFRSNKILNNNNLEEKMNKLEGKLVRFTDQGFGPILMFEDNLDLGYDSSHSFEEGDYLKVYSPDEKQLSLFSKKTIYWEGKIDSEKLKLCDQYLGNKYSEDKWVKMFEKKLKAELFKRE